MHARNAHAPSDRVAELGLAAAGLARHQQRPPEPDRHVDRGDEFLGEDVVAPLGRHGAAVLLDLDDVAAVLWEAVEPHEPSLSSPTALFFST